MVTRCLRILLYLPCLRAVLLVVALLAVELSVGAVVVGEGVEQPVAVFAPEAVAVVPRSLAKWNRCSRNLR